MRAVESRVAFCPISEGGTPHASLLSLINVTMRIERSRRDGGTVRYGAATTDMKMLCRSFSLVSNKIKAKENKL